MGLFLSDAPADVAVIGTPPMLPRLARAVERLGLPVRPVSPERAETEGIGASFHCVESAALSGRPCPRPAVVVCTYGSVPRRFGVTPVPMSGLAPTSLLGAMLHADLQIDPQPLARLVPSVPVDLMAAFLCRPLAFAKRQDLSRLLDLSRGAVQRWLRDSGYKCPAHFFTRCRAEAWMLLAGRGVRPSVLEPYLGIHRHTNFARSCARAGVPIPWESAAVPWSHSIGVNLVRTEPSQFDRSLSPTTL
jgi:hypothetical protein